MVKARIRHLPWGFEFSFLHPNKWIFQTQTIISIVNGCKGLASYKMDNTNTGTYITPTIGIQKVVYHEWSWQWIGRLLPQDHLSCYSVDLNLASRSKVHKVLTFRRDGIPSFSLGKKSVKDLQPALKFRTSGLPWKPTAGYRRFLFLETSGGCVSLCRIQFHSQVLLLIQGWWEVNFLLGELGWQGKSGGVFFSSSVTSNRKDSSHI